MQIHRSHGAVFQSIGGSLVGHAGFQQTLQRHAIEARVAHDAFLMLAQIGLDMGRKVSCFITVKTIMGRQCLVARRRPVADLLFGGHRRVPLRRRSFVDNAAHEIDLAAKLREHGRSEDFLFGEAECFGRPQHDEKVTGWFGVNKFIGDLFADRPHQIAVHFQKCNVSMIGTRR